MKFRFSFAVVASAIQCLAATSARAQLAPSSPFLPAGTMTGSGKGSDDPVELRGIISEPEETLFCIYNTAKKSSSWVGLNEEEGGLVVTSYAPASDTVTVRSPSGIITLTLRTGKVLAGITAVSAASSLPAAAGAQPGAHEATPDEMARLKEAYAQVARRRALREQAMKESKPPANANGIEP